MSSPDLTIVIPARNESENLRVLLPQLGKTTRALSISSEVIVVDGRSEDETVRVVRALGHRVIEQSRPGYGDALREGFRSAQGQYILTMDADLSHEPAFITKLWANRHAAELVIASRYTRGGVAYMPVFRKVLSRVLNRVFARGLSLDIWDLSSGLRLYNATVLRSLSFTGTDFDVLPEIVVRCQAAGWRILEVPFTYFPRRQGSSQARIVRVGANLAKTFVRMWRLRHSISAADYDERAFYSWIPLQRMWQRRRHRIITTFARGGGRTLDVGCGSSVILQSLNDAIGIDIRHSKMRYMKRYRTPVITGSVFALPFANGVMGCVICSEVIEHVPPDPTMFVELDRVLQPGGLLILGTPDYATVTWPVIEQLYRRLAPGGYADEHISHYTRSGIEQLLQRMGYQIVDVQYVCGSELIVSARKGNRAIHADELLPLLPTRQPRGTTEGRLGICMLATKFYASSDMGGGLERSAHRLMEELLQAGHRIVVLTRNYDGLARREEIDGVPVERFPIWGRSRVMVSLSYLVQSLWWLMRHRRDYQIIHCHQSYAPATAAVFAKLLLGKPVLVKISTADEFSERRELERLPLFPLRRWLLQRVDRFVVVNRLACQEFAGLRIAPDRMMQIPNGVVVPREVAFDEKARQAARARLGLRWKSIVLFVGRLSAEKNLSTLIDAWPAIVRAQPDANLLLVGDGGTFRNVESELREHVHRLGLGQQVHFMGRTSEVSDFLIAADLFVLPSETEGMSNALLEAMAAGLPVVATRIPGNLEVIRDGENGRLVETHDAAQFSTVITHLLTSREEACRLGRAARRTVEERFTMQRIGQAYQTLYAELVGGGAPRR